MKKLYHFYGRLKYKFVYSEINAKLEYELLVFNYNWRNRRRNRKKKNRYLFIF